MQRLGCNSCSWWKPGNDNMGECHINSPLHISPFTGRGLWPKTAAMDWCSEYQDVELRGLGDDDDDDKPEPKPEPPKPTPQAAAKELPKPADKKPESKPKEEFKFNRINLDVLQPSNN